MLYKARNKVIEFFDKYFSMVSKAKPTAIIGAGLQILTPTYASRITNSSCTIRAGKNTERLLNEIRQVVYSLHQSKEINKKVYNNIIKSIQL